MLLYNKKERNMYYLRKRSFYGLMKNSLELKAIF